MSKRIQRARDIFRKKFYNDSYNGTFHVSVGFLLFFLFTTLPWPFVREINIFSLLTFILSFIIFTFALYYQHRFPQHKLMRGFKFFYKIHRVHHSFFDYDHMYVDDQNDNLFILFPISFIISYCLVLFPLFLSPLLLINPDTFFISLSACCFYFFCHEIIHYLGHTKGSSAIYKNKVVAFLCEHHRIHHDRKEEPVVNFNMILPLGDLIFKTFKTKSKATNQSLNHKQA